MITIYKILKNATLVLLFAIAASSCKKPVHPALGNYPKDSAPPGGPLKFYAAFEATKSGSVFDSIRANFGTPTNATVASGGVSGSCLSFTNNGFVAFPSANDFANSTSFTVSFWLKTTLAQKDNVNADGVLTLASANNFWGEMTWYADHTTGGNSDSMDLKVHWANGSGDNWDFAGYTGNARWPHMYDGNWHNVVFVYDATSKTATLYRDAVQFDQKTNETIAFDGVPSALIVGGFEQANNIQGNYAGNTWMSGFPGNIDQIRMYGTALAASDVTAIYNGKE